MKRPFVTPGGSRGGFTLIEVMLAVGILVFGAAAIIGMLTVGAAMTRTAELRTSAASSLEAVLDDLDHQLFRLEDGELTGPHDVIDRAVPDAPGVVYSATAVQNPDRPKEYVVDVHLRWEAAGVQRSKRFQTLKLKEISFGERLRREFIEHSGGFSDSTSHTADDAAVE
ncbi:MAG: hypothetical protein KDC14_15695 [Planctomycetes bacterium]|nr:hypothetical protein [Planctomycetota bacterium]